MHVGEGFIVASGFNPGEFIDQIGGMGLAAIVIAFVVAVIIIKIVFSILKKVLAVVVTLVLIAVLGGGAIGLGTGAFGPISDIFNTIFDAMPWN